MCSNLLVLLCYIVETDRNKHHENGTCVEFRELTMYSQTSVTCTSWCHKSQLLISSLQNVIVSSLFYILTERYVDNTCIVCRGIKHVSRDQPTWSCDQPTCAPPLLSIMFFVLRITFQAIVIIQCGSVILVCSVMFTIPFELFLSFFSVSFELRNICLVNRNCPSINLFKTFKNNVNTVSK